MSMKEEAGLGPAVHWIQQALITAYDDNCPLRLAKKGRKSMKWTSELEPLRREVRRLFNRCQENNKPSSWELYRKAQRRYRKEVHKASKETWRTFCSSVNDLPRSAKLHRALSKDPKIRLGSLVAPTGEHMQSEGETLDLLLATHFPNSDVGEGGAVPAAAHRAIRVDWRGSLPIAGWSGRLTHSPHTKAQLQMESSWPFYKREGRSFFRTWLESFALAWQPDMFQFRDARLR